MDRAEQLANAAVNEARALRRENQGLKNQMAALDRRLRALEATDDPDVEYPHHVLGTTGRGIRYRLSDGSEIKAGKVKALAAEDALKAMAQ